MTPPKFHREDLIACGLVLAVWFAFVPVLGVSGEFPLSDDWAYIWSTERFLESGEFRRDRWTFAPILTNVGIGVVFSKLFGFSIATLRASNVVMGAVGLIGAYALARRFGATPRVSAFAASALALNPIYLNLSYTFMTDIAFSALFTWSLVFLAQGIAGPSWLGAALGLLAAAAATLSRQPGIAAALGFAVVAPIRSRALGLAVFGGGLVAGVAALALGLDLAPSRDAAEGLSLSLIVAYIAPNPSALPYLYARNLAAALPYLGFFMLPVLPFAVRGIRERRGLAISAVLTAGISLALPSLLALPMPPGLNIIHSLGLGPITLAGRSLLTPIPDGFWTLCVAVGGASAGAVLFVVALALWRERGRLAQHTAWLLIIATSVVYLGVLMARSPFFDRYLLAVLPGACALVLSCADALRPPPERESGLAIGAALLATLVLGVYGVTGTYDYLAHHRARANLFEDLLADTTPPRCIDGGFELAGSELLVYGSERLFLDNGRRWVEHDDFLISYAADVPGFERLGERSYRLWLRGSESIYAHARPEHERQPECR